MDREIGIGNEPSLFCSGLTLFDRIPFPMESIRRLSLALPLLRSRVFTPIWIPTSSWLDRPTARPMSEKNVNISKCLKEDSDFSAEDEYFRFLDSGDVLVSDMRGTMDWIELYFVSKSPQEVVDMPKISVGEIRTNDWRWPFDGFSSDDIRGTVPERS